MKHLKRAKKWSMVVFQLFGYLIVLFLVLFAYTGILDVIFTRSEMPYYHVIRRGATYLTLFIFSMFYLGFLLKKGFSLWSFTIFIADYVFLGMMVHLQIWLMVKKYAPTPIEELPLLYLESGLWLAAAFYLAIGSMVMIYRRGDRWHENWVRKRSL